MNTQTIVFGGGCFWCTEAVFQRLRGVIKVTAGYAGGSTKDPSYYRVASGAADHAEVIEIQFDPSVIALEQLFAVFFATHDPTTPNRQGHDVGPAYRSVILTTSDEQHNAARTYIAKLETENIFPNSIVTEVKPLTVFYPAEDYHQNYYNQNSEQPYCQVVINPKLEKLRATFAHLLSE